MTKPGILGRPPLLLSSKMVGYSRVMFDFYAKEKDFSSKVLLKPS